MRLPHMNKPCRNCPFRRDAPKGWLGETRMKEMLDADLFPCHKTVGRTTTRMQCAGHMLMKGDRNTFVRTARRMLLPLDLTGSEIVFSSHADCIEHHSN